MLVQGTPVQQAVQCLALSHCENPFYGSSFLMKATGRRTPWKAYWSSEMGSTFHPFDESPHDEPQRLSNHIWLPCCLLGGSKSHIYGDRQNFWPNISFLNKIKVRREGKNNWEIMGQPKTFCVSQMHSIQHCEWKVIFSWKNTWISMTFTQLFKIRSIFSLSADPVKYKPTLGEDLACVIWDILPPQRGSKIAREELDVSQAKQMAAAKGTERCRSTPGNHIFLGRGSEGPRVWWVLGTLWAHVKIQNIEHAGRT